MFKHVIMTFGMLIFLSSVGNAQIAYPSGQCQIAPRLAVAPATLVGCIDWIQPEGIAGWGLDLNSGHEPSMLVLAERVPTMQVIHTVVLPVVRPDVDVAYAQSDPNLGFVLLLDKPLERGVYTLSFEDIPNSWMCSFAGTWCNYVTNTITFTVGVVIRSDPKVPSGGSQ